ncbi:MAG TPA: chemotaxis response regulator protein-glutamate methylesterase [Bryobacteraceae bacterium]|nr:chemotaxis response regulator protein-glutamate methylesterase [Bryobacteraceae bacterium]
MRPIQARSLKPGEKIRVLVVDDSVVIRRLVTHALEQDPALEVVGVAANGALALERVAQLNPDVITLDIEMPELDGLEMLRRLRRADRDTRVIMFSTMTERGAAATIDALSLGADDYVTKASNSGSLDVSMANLRQELIPKVRQFFRFETAHPAAPQVRPAAFDAPRFGECLKVRFRPRAVAIGVSTGGPVALTSILPTFPAEFRLPIFIVQHMPPLFTKFLAERLAGLSQLAVKEPSPGEKPRPGCVYIAPGDYHMKVLNSPDGAEIALDQSPPLNSCRPAVDALFSSLADAYGGAVIAAVLTGMGQDGLRGAQKLRALGASILAQDEASSVVWGMPGALVRNGVADVVFPLDAIVPAILRTVEGA